MPIHKPSADEINEEEYQRFIAQYLIEHEKQWSVVPDLSDSYPERKAKFLDTHGKAIYKAYLTQQSLRAQGIPSFFTAQRIDAIIFQIVIKKLYETLIKDPGKHKKLTRANLSQELDIQNLIQKGEAPNEFLAASSCVHDFSHGESYSFFLGGGISNASYFQFLIKLGEVLLKDPFNLKPDVINQIVSHVKFAWDVFKKELPSSILELAILENPADMKAALLICGDWGSNQRSPTDINQLLNAQELANKIQVRILAPRPGDTEKIKMLRFVPDNCQEVLNGFKQELQALLNTLFPKQSRPSIRINRNTSSEKKPEDDIRDKRETPSNKTENRM